MASSAESASYIQDALETVEDIKEAGRQASFGNLGDPLKPYLDSQAFTEVGKAHVLTLDFDENFSSDVKKDDLFYLVTNEVELENVTHMDTDYKIVKVKPLNFDGITTILYEIQVRK